MRSPYGRARPSSQRRPRTAPAKATSSPSRTWSPSGASMRRRDILHFTPTACAARTSGAAAPFIAPAISKSPGWGMRRRRRAPPSNERPRNGRVHEHGSERSRRCGREHGHEQETMVVPTQQSRQQASARPVPRASSTSPASAGAAAAPSPMARGRETARLRTATVGVGVKSDSPCQSSPSRPSTAPAANHRMRGMLPLPLDAAPVTVTLPETAVLWRESHTHEDARDGDSDDDDRVDGGGRAYRDWSGMRRRQYSGARGIDGSLMALAKALQAATSTHRGISSGSAQVHNHGLDSRTGNDVNTRDALSTLPIRHLRKLARLRRYNTALSDRDLQQHAVRLLVARLATQHHSTLGVAMKRWRIRAANIKRANRHDINDLVVSVRATRLLARAAAKTRQCAALAQWCAFVRHSRHAQAKQTLDCVAAAATACQRRVRGRQARRAAQQLRRSLKWHRASIIRVLSVDRRLRAVKRARFAALQARLARARTKWAIHYLQHMMRRWISQREQRDVKCLMNRATHAKIDILYYIGRVQAWARGRYRRNSFLMRHGEHLETKRRIRRDEKILHMAQADAALALQCRIRAWLAWCRYSEWKEWQLSCASLVVVIARAWRAHRLHLVIDDRVAKKALLRYEARVAAEAEARRIAALQLRTALLLQRWWKRGGCWFRLRFLIAAQARRKAEDERREAFRQMRLAAATRYAQRWWRHTRGMYALQRRFMARRVLLDQLQSSAKLVQTRWRGVLERMRTAEWAGQTVAHALAEVTPGKRPSVPSDLLELLRWTVWAQHVWRGRKHVRDAIRLRRRLEAAKLEREQWLQWARTNLARHFNPLCRQVLARMRARAFLLEQSGGYTIYTHLVNHRLLWLLGRVTRLQRAWLTALWHKDLGRRFRARKRLIILERSGAALITRAWRGARDRWRVSRMRGAALALIEGSRYVSWRRQRARNAADAEAEHRATCRALRAAEYKRRDGLRTGHQIVAAAWGCVCDEPGDIYGDGVTWVWFNALTCATRKTCPTEYAALRSCNNPVCKCGTQCGMEEALDLRPGPRKYGNAQDEQLQLKKDKERHVAQIGTNSERREPRKPIKKQVKDETAWLEESSSDDEYESGRRRKLKPARIEQQVETSEDDSETDVEDSDDDDWWIPVPHEERIGRGVFYCQQCWFSLENYKALLQQPLPPGWSQEFYHKKFTIRYTNLKTKETQLHPDRPTEPPEGWIEVDDEPAEPGKKKKRKVIPPDKAAFHFAAMRYYHNMAEDEDFVQLRVQRAPVPEKIGWKRPTAVRGRNLLYSYVAPGTYGALD